jgi:phage-related protein
MFYIHDALRGMNGILSFTKTNTDKVLIFELLDSLGNDTLATLESETTKKMRATKNKVAEISLASMRIFYVQQGSDICIVHLSYKQKNKTERKDISIADKRAGELKHKNKVS